MRASAGHIFAVLLVNAMEAGKGACTEPDRRIAMRCALFPLIDEAAWDKLSQEERGREIAAYGAFAGALRESGALIGAYRPESSAKAKTVRVANDEVQVQDGPYADTKEQLGGIYIIEVPDLDTALSWASRVPAARYGAVEVRPIREQRG
jgi:hypothetical protein